MARRHIAIARAITLNIVIHEVEEIGGSIARHPHEFGSERGRHGHPSDSRWKIENSKLIIACTLLIAGFEQRVYSE